MSKSIITVENIGKKYLIGHQQKKSQMSFKEAMVGAAKSFAQRVRHPFLANTNDIEEFWALKDVNFEIKEGERVGIVGKNGSGKSTLLKILSRIVEPTTGKAVLRGRVGSLLEVGTGFHPELSGRENVYLNGAILGMSRKEINKKFDEIVEFSGVEKFLDTPVKRYSSGMYVRLAFAVAAHLEPDILIVDEVLAVGDAQFQKRCLGKMEDVSKEGRTVVFVSHNMAALENLCSKAILINSGSVVKEGDTKGVVSHYLNELIPNTINNISLIDRKDRKGNGKIKFSYFHVEDLKGNKLSTIRSGMDVNFVFGFKRYTDKPLNDVDIGFSISTKYKQLITVLYSSFLDQKMNNVPESGEFRCTINNFPFSEGEYFVNGRLVVNNDDADCILESLSEINVESGDYYKTGHAGYGSLSPMLMNGKWSIKS